MNRETMTSCVLNRTRTPTYTHTHTYTHTRTHTQVRTSFQRGLKPLSLTVAVLDSLESSGMPVSQIKRGGEVKNE